MVACTATHNLPFQEDTTNEADRPCNLSAVWCQFAQIVGDKFIAYDQILARTVTTVPFAKVQATIAQTISSTPFLRPFMVWDTVAGDNDNMVDLEADPTSIRIRRPGLWQINFVILCSAVSNDQRLDTFGIDDIFDVNVGRITSVSNKRWRTPVTEEFDINDVTLQSQVLMAYNQATIDVNPGIPLQLTVDVDGVDQDVPISYAEMTAVWHAELP